jgi:replication factor C subunit 3/5
MFLTDKYKINNITEISYHRDIYEKILGPEKIYINSNYKLNQINDIKEIEVDRFNNFSNILVYGPECSGKKTLVRLLLNTIYNTNIKTKMVKYIITNYGNSNVDIEIQQSNYHIEIDPTNKGIDKYIIQDIIGQYIKYNGMGLFNNKIKYRVVVINNIHNLSYYAQTSLRRMMEKYVKYCRFIIIGNQISKIIEPLKSRCIPIKLRAPNKYEIYEYLYTIIQKENIEIDIKILILICERCNRNIKNAIWLLEMYKDLNYIDYIDSWKEYIRELINIIFQVNINILDNTIFENINEYIYKVYITTIPPDKILKEILNQILIKVKNNIIAYDIIDLAVKYDYRLTNGKRSINHLEGFVYGVINILNK